MSYVRTEEERVAGILSQVASRIRMAARCATGSSGSSVFLPRSFIEGDGSKGVDIALSSYAVTVPGELVRAHFDQFDFAAFAFDVRDTLRMEIEPFIVGVGHVAVEKSPEGLVVRLVDEREIGDGHKVTPEMIEAALEEYARGDERFDSRREVVARICRSVLLFLQQGDDTLSLPGRFKVGPG